MEFCVWNLKNWNLKMNVCNPSHGNNAHKPDMPTNACNEEKIIYK